MKQALYTFHILLLAMFVLTGNQAFAADKTTQGGMEPAIAGVLGEVNFPISCSKEAQKRFNKGLALLHNMMYQQAQKEFEALAFREPDCAMAHWGVAMTQLHPLWAPPSDYELKRGFDEIVSAQKLKPPTKREMAYLDAAKAFFGDWNRVDHATRIARWAEAQKMLYQKYPNDIDAGALYALSNLATAPKGDKTFSHQKESGKLLEELRKKAPRHPGLFHYTIHAYDNPMLAERALEVAREYDKIAPDAPHAQHMPSHIFVRMGMWPNTIEWNRRSADAAKEQSKPDELSLHYIHALDYLMYAYLQRAEDVQAQKTLDEINAVKNYQDSFASSYGIAAAQARYPLELRQWEKAAKLQVRTHPEFPWDKYPWHEAITYFARGIGAARSGDAGAALDAKKSIDTFYDETVKVGQDYWAVLVDSQRKSVAAWAAYAQGKDDEALKMMQEATDIEDSVDKHPVTPGAVLPARELLGDMLSEMGKYKEAVSAYEASLRISPNRFNSLYGAGYAAERAGEKDKAKYYYGRLLEVTTGSDGTRPRLQEAMSFMNKK